MDAEEQQHIANLLKQHRRRLQLLEERAAKTGTNTPVELIIEIQDLQETITQLQSRLNGEEQNSQSSLNTAEQQAGSATGSPGNNPSGSIRLPPEPATVPEQGNSANHTWSIERIAAVATVVALLIALLALARDTFNFTVPLNAPTAVVGTASSNTQLATESSQVSTVVSTQPTQPVKKPLVSIKVSHQPLSGEDWRSSPRPLPGEDWRSIPNRNFALDVSPEISCLRWVIREAGAQNATFSVGLDNPWYSGQEDRHDVITNIHNGSCTKPVSGDRLYIGGVSGTDIDFTVDIYAE